MLTRPSWWLVSGIVRQLRKEKKILEASSFVKNSRSPRFFFCFLIWFINTLDYSDYLFYHYTPFDSSRNWQINREFKKKKRRFPVNNGNHDLFCSLLFARSTFNCSHVLFRRRVICGIDKVKIIFHEYYRCIVRAIMFQLTFHSYWWNTVQTNKLSHALIIVKPVQRAC